MAAPLKIVVEKHPDGYVSYPLGLARGVIAGQGDTCEEALADVRSAIAFHVETFGPESLAALDHPCTPQHQGFHAADHFDAERHHAGRLPPRIRRGMKFVIARTGASGAFRSVSRGA